MLTSPAPVVDLVRRRRNPSSSGHWSTAAAVLACLAGLWLSGNAQPLLVPLTALLVVQVTLYATFTLGIRRIASVVAGVLIAVGFTEAVGLTWWSLGLLVLVCLPSATCCIWPQGEEVAVGTCSSSASAGNGPRALGRVIATPVGVTVGVLLNPVVARPSTWGLPARRPGTSRHGCGWCCGSATKWCTAPPPAM
ncbi:aromatic acid exporter family protein [Streptomyces sp. NPDC058107]|uniref:FUSC family protein n=1 Tax=Streptomyces sp. NPDC058107 TaxID=3346343 RepID=UPI0036E46243